MTEARTYMDGYSDGKEWAQADMLRTVEPMTAAGVDAALARLAEIEKQEPIYQYQRADGGWIDQTKNGYDYNVRYGAATVRILYASAGASPVEPSESVEHRDELAKRKPEPAAETVGGLAKAVKAARGGDAPPAPMQRFA